MEAQIKRATAPSTRKLIKTWLPRVPALLPLYGVLLGFCYMWAFWGAFDVNPFQYVGISDIVVISAQYVLPIMLGLALLAPGMIAAFGERDEAQTPPPAQPPSTFTRLAVWIHRRLPSLASATGGILSVVSVVALLVLGSLYEWDFTASLVTFLVLFLATIALARAGFQIDFLVVFPVWFIMGLPALVYDRGTVNARKAWSSDSSITIVLATLAVPLKFKGKHLGHLGEHDFFFEGTTLRIIPTASIRSVELSIHNPELQRRRATEELEQFRKKAGTSTSLD